MLTYNSCMNRTINQKKRGSEDSLLKQPTPSIVGSLHLLRLMTLPFLIPTYHRILYNMNNNNYNI